MKSLSNLFDRIASFIEFIVVSSATLVFIFDSLRSADQTVLAISLFGYFIYLAVWRLRFN